MLTLKQFRKLTRGLPEDSIIEYDIDPEGIVVEKRAVITGYTPTIPEYPIKQDITVINFR